MNRFPAMFKLFGNATATFREAGVADFSFVSKYFSPRRFDDGLNIRILGRTCHTLVALAMIVGADIKQGVVFAVVPADQFLIVPETTLYMFRLFTLLFDLCQYPASGNNGMGFQKFSWRTGIHLRSNHARQILF